MNHKIKNMQHQENNNKHIKQATPRTQRKQTRMQQRDIVNGGNIRRHTQTMQNIKKTSTQTMYHLEN